MSDLETLRLAFRGLSDEEEEDGDVKLDNEIEEVEEVEDAEEKEGF